MEPLDQACCVAVVEHSKCDHATMIKLGCSFNCEALCPTDRQRALVVTKFRGRCEKCQDIRWADVQRDSAKQWNDELAYIRAVSNLTEEQREHLLRRTEDEQIATYNRYFRGRLGLLDDVRFANWWTWRRGSLERSILYGQGRDPREYKKEFIKHLKLGLKTSNLIVVEDSLGLAEGRELQESQKPLRNWDINTYYVERTPEQPVGLQRASSPAPVEGPGVNELSSDFSDDTTLVDSDDMGDFSDDENMMHGDDGIRYDDVDYDDDFEDVYDSNIEHDYSLVYRSPDDGYGELDFEDDNEALISEPEEVSDLCLWE